MFRMLLIHVALAFEAKPFLRAADLKQVASPAGGRLFLNGESSLALAVTGVGGDRTERVLKATRDALSRRALAVQCGLNVGLAGILNRSHPIGSILRIGRIRHGAALSDTHPEIALETQSATFRWLGSFPLAELTTLDKIACDSQAEPAPSGRPFLVDMEGWHFAQTLLRTFRIGPSGIASVKIISDLADGTRIDTQALAAQYDGAVTRLLQGRPPD